MNKTIFINVFKNCLNILKGEMIETHKNYFNVFL